MSSRRRTSHSRRSPRASPRTRQRWWRAYKRAPTGARVILGVCALLVVAIVANTVYQVYRKPTELFFPVSGALYKTPPETWREYSDLFRRYSTDTLTPELLAAIAQVEGSGNPIARTYWRWSWSGSLFELYRPASSSVGMYQMTDGTFALARHYCIHHHVVTDDGPWDQWRSCWFTAFYTRVLPGDAVELASAYLDHSVQEILARHQAGSVSLARRQDLATLIHLCGAGAGEEFARHGFSVTNGQRCGDESPRVYLARVHALKQEFDRLSASDLDRG